MNDQEIYDLNDFLEGRSNPEAYGVLFSVFLPAVIGKLSFQDKILEAYDGGRELCTKSDEAFVLLLLENSIDRWKDIFTRSQGRTTPSRGSRRRKWYSNITPKYTCGGIIFNKEDDEGSPTDVPKASAPQQKAVGKGWNNMGIKRFNELFALVNVDRSNHPGFTRNWMIDYMAAMRPKKKSKRFVTLAPDASHELWDASDVEDPHQPGGNDDDEDEPGSDSSSAQFNGDD